MSAHSPSITAAPRGWHNPLRDKRDKRMPRLAGPCGVVIFSWLKAATLRLEGLSSDSAAAERTKPSPPWVARL